MATTRTYGGRPVADRRADRRSTFLGAARMVFADKGFTASTISDVCSSANLSRQQFYDLFSNSEDLLLAAYDDIQDRARRAVLEAITTQTRKDPAAVVRAAVGAYVGAIGRDWRRTRIAFVEIVGVSDRVESHRAAVREQWSMLFDDVITEFSGPPPQHSIGMPMLSATIIGSINGLVHFWSENQRTASESEVIDVLVELVLALLYPGSARLDQDSTGTAATDP